MKALYCFIIAFVATIVISCEKETGNRINLNIPETVHAGTEESATTKTSLAYVDDVYEVHWSLGDAIAVFPGNTQMQKYDLNDEDAGKDSGEFTRSSTYKPSGFGHAIVGSIAIYPFKTEISLDSEKKASIVMEETQTYVADSFDKDASLMMAENSETTDIDFTFKNLCGALKLNLKGTGSVKNIIVSGNEGELLSGKAAAYFTDDTKDGKEVRLPSMTLNAEGGRSVTLECGGISLSEDKAATFIIVLPPVQMKKGFTVKITSTEGKTCLLKTDKPQEIKRSVILNMKEKECDFRYNYIDDKGNAHGPGVEIGGTVWAPVNCGYDPSVHKYGLLYQWGRKYGQGYDDKPTAEDGPILLKDGQDVTNKDVFYTCDGKWWGNEVDNKLWNLDREKPSKTDNDPCPDGWRVPSDIAFIKLLENHSGWTTKEGMKGYWFSGNTSYTESAARIFLPAAGYRSGTDCSVSGQGENGCYWTSEYAGDEEGYYIDFYEGDDIGQSTYIVAGGCSVRCVAI